jgi:ATP-dependent Lon protease
VEVHLFNQMKLRLLKTMVRFKTLNSSLALNAYLSTPKFIKNLTDISNELITVTNREEYLKEQLKSINKMLPASVYIPLVNGTDFRLNF